MTLLSDLCNRFSNRDEIGKIRITTHGFYAADEMPAWGQEVRIVDYPEYFAKVGRKYGPGNGTTTFNIIDLRGVALAGRDNLGDHFRANRLNNTTGFNPVQYGARAGQDQHYIDPDEMPFRGLITEQVDHTVAAGLTTGSGGNMMYRTNGEGNPFSMLQPTSLVDFVVKMGRNVVGHDPVTIPVGTSDLEFNGPFVDWTNVVTQYGADPTGQTDSTQAIQNCLNDLSRRLVNGGTYGQSGYWESRIAYFPPGRYLISKTLLLPDKTSESGVVAAGISLWGDDAATTTLVWTGSQDGLALGSMIWGCGWGQGGAIARLTLDGQSQADIGIRFERDHGINISQTGLRIQDCIFRDLAYGFRNTYFSPGEGTDSEVSIIRCQFIRCTGMAVCADEAEGYDYWVRQCYFESCHVGVGSTPGLWYTDFKLGQTSTTDPNAGSGSVSVQDCVFNSSGLYDVFWGQGENSSVTRNVSVNSNRFMIAFAGSVAVHSNRIINPLNSDCLQLVTQYYSMGCPTVFGNEFTLLPGTTGAIVVELFDTTRESTDPRTTDNKSSVSIFFGNKFSVNYSGVYQFDPRFTDRLELGTLINQTLDTTVVRTPFATKVARQTYWAQGGDTFQSQVNAAAAYESAHPGSNPVVYVAASGSSGHMNIAPNPVVFPANQKITLTAGGGANITWYLSGLYDTTHDSIPYLILRGPSKVVIDNFSVTNANEGGKTGLHIVVDNCDQAGARVWIDNGNVSLDVEGPANLKLDITDTNLGGQAGSQNAKDLYFTGNASASGSGRTLIENGTFSAGGWSPVDQHPGMTVGAGAQMYMRGIWYETDEVNQLTLNVTGSAQKRGWFSVESSRFVPGNQVFPPRFRWHDIPQMKVDAYAGDIMLVGCPRWYGRVNFVTSASSTTFTTWGTNVQFLCDGGLFKTYSGHTINIIDTVYPPDNATPASHALPGYPSSYSGQIGDAYYTDDGNQINTSHLWVWSGSTWVDLGGIIATVANAAALPTPYSGLVTGGGSPVPVGSLVGDCYLTANDLHVHKWNGTAWVDLGGSDIVPSGFSAYQQSQYTLSGNYISPRGWRDGPVPKAGTFLSDYQARFTQMLSVVPPVRLSPTGSGLTDLRLHRVGGHVTFITGTFS